MTHRWLLHTGWLLGCLLLAGPTVAQQAIVSDGLGTTINQVGNTVEITGGTEIGGRNLFHSFSRFDVPLNGIADFRNDATISNIFARITGGIPSDIQGALRSQGTANLFLINPAGIVFGPNASLNLGGSFVATTATAIQFGDRDVFSTSPATSPSPLLTINPSALVFNQLNPGPILMRSQAPAGLNPYGNPATGLRVPDGQSLLLVGGNITLDGGRLRAYGGRVELAGISAPGRINLFSGSPSVNGSPPQLQMPSDAIRADVSLIDAVISSFNSTGGDMSLYGRTLTLMGSNLFGGLSPSNGAVGAQAGDITLDATNTILWGPGSIIDANVDAGAVGNGGQIILRAGSRVVLDGLPNANGDGGVMTAQLNPGGIGRAGTIQMTTGSLELLNGVLVSTSSLGQGAPGTIEINARDRVVLAGQDRTGFSSTVRSNLNGGVSRDTPGRIQITTGTLRLTDGAQISAGNIGGQGQSGTIQIQAQGAVELTQRSLISSQVQAGGAGDGGAIVIQAGALSLLSGGQITTGIRGQELSEQPNQGNGGAITLNIRGAVVLDSSADRRSQIGSSIGLAARGNAGPITINAESLFLNRAAISSTAFGLGNGGNITIQVADAIQLSNGSLLATGLATPDNLPTALGDGGELRIQARTLALTDSSGITSQNSGEGNAGNQWITVDTLRLNNSSIISSSTQSGQAGTIQIEARDAVILEGRQANIQAILSGRGRGGQILINTSDLALINALGISAVTDGNGAAGDITLNVRDRLLVDNSLIFSSVGINGQGQGGNIAIQTGSLLLRNDGIINAATYGQGDAGDITITSRNGITLVGSRPSTITVESRSTGATGDIVITSPRLIIADKSSINANSDTGNGGNIILSLGKFLQLRSGSNISTSAGTAQAGGDGGNITIVAPQGFIIGVKNENSDISANAFTGSGGRVNITAQGIYGLQFRPQLTPFSDATASSTFGLSGTVTVDTPNIDPSRGLTELPDNLIETNRILASSCLARRPDGRGTFYITGNGGLPQRPGDPPTPWFSTGEVQSIPETTAGAGGG
jgi:filamentous hemagglutinin family protein